MQADVGEEQNDFNVVWEPAGRKSRPSVSTLNHPLKSSHRMMLSLFEKLIFGLERNVVTRLNGEYLWKRCLMRRNNWYVRKRKRLTSRLCWCSLCWHRQLLKCCLEMSFSMALLYGSW